MTNDYVAKLMKYNDACCLGVIVGPAIAMHPKHGNVTYDTNAILLLPRVYIIYVYSYNSVLSGVC